jgi:diguanylate cyclase (GGDEF)-like protein/PAS domain S-box-containing protein
MKLQSANVLLINDDPVLSASILKALHAPDSGSFSVESVKSLAEGLSRLAAKGISAILLSLSLPDSQGLKGFQEIFAAAPETPILILGQAGQEELALQAVKAGAQDYLLPHHLDAYILSRALRNAIERKAIEDDLYMEKERALVTLNSIGDAVLCTDVEGNVTYLNLVAETMTGWSRTEAINQPLNQVFKIIDGTTREIARDPMMMAVEQNRTVGLPMNCVLIRRDGYESVIEDSSAPIHDRKGRVIGAVIVFHDVSAAMARSIQMTQSAQHDLVTNLPNRLLLNDRIRQATALAQRQRKQAAILFIDLDNFKFVNDSFGHAVGDKLLRSVAERLVSSIRASDAVSRQGGDEFVTLLSSIESREAAATTARRILSALGRPHLIDSHVLQISASIGISVYPEDGQDMETLVDNADTAMYSAKESGRNNYQFFNIEMNQRAVERQSMEETLRRALDCEEFLLHYQPKVSLESGRITGVEALIRWQPAGKELVPPEQFVPLAEENGGLIVRLGKWVLREACSQARIWQDAGLEPVSVAINVSATEFSDPDLITRIRSALEETRLDPRYLEVELTESVLMKDVEATASVLRELKAMGVRLAIDDFGTGYSSLSYLQRLPIDTLKIDRSFIQRITTDPGDSVVVSAIIKLAESLKLLVVAEGIETEEQRSYLMSQNCHEGQGFLFSRPVEADKFAELLASWANAPAFSQSPR